MTLDALRSARQAVALLGLLSVGLAPAVARADVPEDGSNDGAATGGRTELPIEVPERPFLLVEAPRRFLPTEQAEARVQLVRGGRVSLAVFRVLDPTSILATGRRRQGISVAQTPLGEEAERLVTASGRLPRRGSRLELVAVRAASVRMAPRVRGRRVHDETPAYDSYEEEETDVETWGVDAGDWAEARVALGRFAPGVYLVRAHRGPFATAALLSVGELTMLVRRGDAHDTVLVTDPAGQPLPGIGVSSWSGTEGNLRRVATAETDARGTARFEPRDDPTLRFVAIRGDDRTWADVTHARLSTCDPIVYLGVDRPVFRSGETIHLRGNARGCPREEYRPLAGETVRVWPARHPDGRSDDDGVDVRTDRDGNFIVELVARGDLGARVRGITHTRSVTIDRRTLPRRSLEVRADRSWAAAGQAVAVTVQDEEGGWPTAGSVTLETPAGRMTAPIGPGRAATFTVRMPPTADVLRAVTLVATLAEGSAVTMARTEVWTGARPELLHIESQRAVAAPDEELEVVLRASDLGGASIAG
ncbi:MAG: hypothetical protein IT379_08620, partial [Deltaproteobacteria bacterium]|nr:hypothetical protein [Deltaproteobacteria bacterium]